MLPDFLAAVDGLWDQLIAVDTGSQDGTVALLQQAGATVVPFPWVDDFAAARNASLDAATGRWILFLDADERVSAPLKEQIRALLDDEQAGAATVVMRNQLPGGHRRDSRLLRLFHNRPEIRFRYRIHEDVAEAVQTYLAGAGLALRHLDGVVDHLGYVREVAAGRDKMQRDLRLLERSLAENDGDDYCRFKILEIARFWDERDLWRRWARLTAEALEQRSAAQRSRLQQNVWSGELAGLVAAGLDLPPAQALAWLEESAPWARPTAAWHLHRALLLENLGRADEAARSYQACMERQGHAEEAAAQLTGVRPLLGLCRLAMADGRREEAARLAARAAQAGPQDPEALLALVTCSPPGQESRAVLFHLEDHLDAATPLARACFGAGRLNLAAAVLRRALDAVPDAPDPEQALGLLVCTLVLGEDFDAEIMADQEQADRWLRGWVGMLWQSRHTEAMAAFAENCQAITGVFGWLPDFLAEETRKLGDSHP